MTKQDTSLLSLENHMISGILITPALKFNEGNKTLA